ncbi:MAG: tetratricopeptide repeat protein [Acidobacteriota bacterium]|jgi:tetratricopeptide (TPR) repeat protein|nr:tetratricopeptide repeat protein [Acidobacteriota bacterium]
MTFLVDFLGALAFNGRAIRALGARGMVGVGAACYCAGVLVYGLVRRAVYADLPEVIGSPSGMTGLWHDLDLVPALAFLLLVYLPSVIALANLLARDGTGFSCSRKEWRAHAAVLLPLWGAVCFIAAPVQWLVPHFLIAGYVEISFGVLVRSLLLAVTTFRAVGSLNRLSPGATTGTLLLSALTLPVYLLMSLYARVLLFVLFASAAVWALAAFRARRVPRGAARRFRRNLDALTVDPENVDAHLELGLAHLEGRDPARARGYFARAVAIAPQDPRCHYLLGRVLEREGDWEGALGRYEEVLRLDPEHGSGAALREAGKARLHLGRVDGAIECLEASLRLRNDDPEAHYWMARAAREAGDSGRMRFHLDLIADRARSRPGRAGKGEREWARRARDLRHGGA